MSSHKDNAIICDIDGCLIYTNWILDEATLRGYNVARMFKYFDQHANDKDNEVDETLVQFLNSLNDNVQIIFVTARTKEIEKPTRENLKRLLPGKDFLLFMREKGDTRHSAEIKEEHLQIILQYYNVLLAIDDCPDNCSVYDRYNVQNVLWKSGEI